MIVTDTLPAGTTFVPGSSSPGLALSPDGKTVLDPIGNLASGASQSVTVVVAPTVAAQNTALTNSATVTGLQNDLNQNNNTAIDSSITVNPAVTVAISQFVTTTVPGVIGVGQGLTYFLSVSNTGPADAHNVVVTDTLPQGVVTNASVVNAPNGHVIVNGNTVTVTYPILAANSGLQTIRIIGLTAGPYTSNTQLLNTATVQENELNLNNQTTATATTNLDTISPTVVSVVRYGYHLYPTVIVVQFSKTLNPATVNLSNFFITNYGNPHRPFWYLQGVPVPIARVAYDPAHNRAFLYPAQLLPLSNTYGVVVTQVTDLVGYPLPSVSTTLINRTSVKGLIPPAYNPLAPLNPTILASKNAALAKIQRS